MDVRMTAKEIGLFETAANLAAVRGSAAVVQKAGTAMPLPSAGIEEETGRAARRLLASGKKKFLFLTPEIALAERMLACSGDREILFLMPCDMEPGARKRLEHNLPGGAGRNGAGNNTRVRLLEEPYFPRDFFPGNSLMVVCGYCGGKRPMVMAETYRLLEHYSGFRGEKLFVPYVQLEQAVRFDGWMEVSAERVRMITGGYYGTDDEEEQADCRRF